MKIAEDDENSRNQGNNIKPCKGSAKIISKYKRENSSENHGQSIDRLYQGNSVIPQAQKRRNSQNETIVEARRLSHDERAKITERLYTGGGDKEDNHAKHTSKWLFQSTQIDLATSKTKTDKLVYERLKRDFQIFFDKDLFLDAVTHATEQTMGSSDRQFSSTVIHQSSSKATLVDDQTSRNLEILWGKQSQYESLMNTSFKSTHSKAVAQAPKGTPILFSNYLHVMATLGFIPSDYKSKRCYEEADLAEIWKILYLEPVDSKKTKDKTIKAENLFIFLAALLNIRLPLMLRKDAQVSVEKDFICFDSDGNAFFKSYEDVGKVYKRFTKLAINRINKRKDD